ncbi:MAG TPA: NAD-dependent epimerase/dehydratase family protein [Terrimicrobiaceae bacterium]
MKPLRIALSGARGRLAPFIATHLHSADHEVVAFSRSAGDGFRCTSLLTAARTLENFDAVVHLGWSTVPLTSQERPGIETTSDLPLLQQILHACASIQRPPQLVFFSSAAVYGNISFAATEKTPCRPVGNYARAKLSAEEVIHSACERHQHLRCCILRISNVFGSAIDPTKPQGIIPRVCRAIHEESPISIWGDGNNTKDYLFLDDFLEAVQIVIECGLTGTFNVASEQALSVREIVSIVESYAGKKLSVAHCPAFSWDVEESRISAQKLKTATGWRARHGIAEAIRQVTDAELRCV